MKAVGIILLVVCSIFAFEVIDTSRLHKHVQMLSETLAPRSYTDRENLLKTSQYIFDEFASLGLLAKTQPFVVKDSLYMNIFTHIGPDTGKQIIVGAHYDGHGPYPAADDNASGVAGILELARLLKNTKLTQGITLIAYTLEEPPFFGTNSMGSFVHAQSLHDANTAVDVMISLEMIGYFSDKSNSQKYPVPVDKAVYPDEGNFIMVVDKEGSMRAKGIQRIMSANSKIPVKLFLAPVSVIGVDFSDHRNYWNFGYEAVMITNTAFYRNTAYHTAKDTHDRLEYFKMGEVVRGVHQYLLRAAGAH